MHCAEHTELTDEGNSLTIADNIEITDALQTVLPLFSQQTIERYRAQ
jgi:hypothetical protein